MLVGDVFDAETVTLITYYVYFIIAGVALFYWKVIEKKPLAVMGLSRETGTYFTGIALNVFLLILSVFIITASGNIKYQRIVEN